KSCVSARRSRGSSLWISCAAEAPGVTAKRRSSNRVAGAATARTRNDQLFERQRNDIPRKPPDPLARILPRRDIPNGKSGRKALFIGTLSHLSASCGPERAEPILCDRVAIRRLR